MENNTFKLIARNGNVPIKVTAGHFATNHSHINYYLDMTTLRSRQSEAQAAARTLVGLYMYQNHIVDTIVCLDGTEVIGAYLADELSKAGYISQNSHKTIYIVTPEFNSNSQIIFRDNIQPMISGKHIIILMASITTGLTINKGLECIQYYGGILQGVSAIFSDLSDINGIPINSIFSRNDLPDYQTYDYHNCPYCKQGIKIDALVNGFGYSKL